MSAITASWTATTPIAATRLTTAIPRGRGPPHDPDLGDRRPAPAARPPDQLLQRQESTRLAGRCSHGRRLKEKREPPTRRAWWSSTRSRRTAWPRSPSVTEARQKLLDYGRPGPEVRQGPGDASRRRQLPCLPAVALRRRWPRRRIPRSGGGASRSWRSTRSGRIRWHVTTHTAERRSGSCDRPRSRPRTEHLAARRDLSSLPSRLPPDRPGDGLGRFLRDRSRWMTVPSRPIRTLLGISVTP